MIEDEITEETLLKEISLLAYDYMMYKLQQYSMTQLRNFYQERLYLGEEEISRGIKVIMNERGCNL